jgi:hypothetical protein
MEKVRVEDACRGFGWWRESEMIKMKWYKMVSLI